MTAYWCEHIWLPPGRVARRVRLDVAAGLVAALTEDSEPGDAHRLRGLVVPGLANTHSHAFHRALRGRTQRASGTFWTWREQMYGVAARLDPDTYFDLARATYAEMALAGVTCVGEFHYLHHGPGGTPYADPNAMGRVLIEAARAAGIRITLLDACYLTGGFGRPLEGVQLRFGDGTAARWAERVTALPAGDAVRIGAAIHSVRAVPAAQLGTAQLCALQLGETLHVHLSEQVAENEQCLAEHGVTPTVLLSKHGALGPRTVAVHATHLTDLDIEVLGFHRTGVCLCPTTERDLADGIGPAGRLQAGGSRLSLGSDSHAVIDLLAEARAVELDQRLATQQRGRFTVAELIEAATRNGHHALGWPEGGQLAVGLVADFIAIRLDSPRTAGGDDPAETAVFAATAADVTDVVVGGRAVVRDGVHLQVPDVGRALSEAIGALDG